MADSLYVCLFSNGHIKVGRSLDTQSRIATHAERVSCMGVELVEHQTFPCDRHSGIRETNLIQRCVAAAAQRFKNEWFTGLDFLEACEWAQEEASRSLSSADTLKSVWSAMLLDMRAVGLTQWGIANHCGCDQSTISALSNGRAKEPLHSLGEKIIALHAERCASPEQQGISHG